MNTQQFNLLVKTLNDIYSGLKAGLDSILAVLSGRPDLTVMEVFEVDTIDANITTSTKRIVAPVINGEKVPWRWMQVKNTGGTNSCRIGINGDGNAGFTLAANETKTIDYRNLRIDEVDYTHITATTTLQIILLRPKAKNEV